MLNKFAAVMLHLLMLVIVCAIAAYWAVRIMTPPPASAPPLQPAAAPREAEPQLAARMMGLVQAASAQVASNIQAVGAFAAGRDSAAVLVIDGKPARVYLLNQEISGGTRLVEVRKDAVTVEQGGLRRDIALPVQELLAVGGSPPPAGFSREGNTLTAPTVGTPGQPAGVPPRSVPPPRPAAVPQPAPQPIPQPMPQQPVEQPQQPGVPPGQPQAFQGQPQPITPTEAPVIGPAGGRAPPSRPATQ